MGRNTNRRLGLVFAAATVLICVPAALAQNEGKSDPQIAAEAAALEQQKKQQSAQQSGQDCKLAGGWLQSTEGVGATGWQITSSGQATDVGIGYAKGTATLTGRTLRINWSTNNGYSGYYEWTLDSSCTSGSGSLVFFTGRTGIYKSTVKR
jgi:hypothetical protein